MSHRFEASQCGRCRHWEHLRAENIEFCVTLHNGFGIQLEILFMLRFLVPSLRAAEPWLLGGGLGGEKGGGWYLHQDGWRVSDGRNNL